MIKNKVFITLFTQMIEYLSQILELKKSTNI
jgi:hypothetical protein